MTRSEFIKRAAQRLQNAGIDDPLREAQLLLQVAGDETRAENWLARREKREPIGRIEGKRGFWKSEFILNEATLEPRPDTETLIETVLEFLPDPHAPLRILDLGTGTGCILLSLLQEYPQSSGLGTDRSARALEAARQNAFALGLAARAEFVQANWAEGISEAFQLLVSNPPYIESAVLKTLAPEVRDFDPALALDGGEDGLDAYRALAKLAPKHLAHKGLCLVEIGQGQEEKTADLFEAAGLKMTAYRRDLGGVIRVLVFENP